MQDIKVSICIPTYNQAEYLALAVRSAFEQTFKPFEIIVYNDCSTDNTAKVLKQLSLEIPSLKTVNQPQNLGIAGNVNCCLRAAIGDFVIRLDSDDLLSPPFTEKLLELFIKYPEAGYAHCAVQEIDQSGNFLNKRQLVRTSGYKSAKDSLKDAIKGYRVSANIIMFKRGALAAVNYIDGRPNYVEDYHLTSSISANGYGNIYFDSVMAYYRIWVDVKKVRQKRKLAEIIGVRRVFKDVLEPAFIKNDWSLDRIKNKKANLACEQADCLGWDVYTENEKVEIKAEILKLSSAPIVRLFTWMYMQGLGSVLKAYSKGKAFPKTIIKAGLKKIEFK